MTKSQLKQIIVEEVNELFGFGKKKKTEPESGPSPVKQPERERDIEDLTNPFRHPQTAEDKEREKWHWENVKKMHKYLWAKSKRNPDSSTMKEYASEVATAGPEFDIITRGKYNGWAVKAITEDPYWTERTLKWPEGNPEIAHLKAAIIRFYGGEDNARAAIANMHAEKPVLSGELANWEPAR